MLFDAVALANQLTPSGVVDYFLRHRALCRFREQCALNGLLRGRVRYLPGQYNLLSWMRERQAQGRWQNVSANPMAYCLSDVREQMAIVLSPPGHFRIKLEPSRHERMDHYWFCWSRRWTSPSVRRSSPMPSGGDGGRCDSSTRNGV